MSQPTNPLSSSCQAAPGCQYRCYNATDQWHHSVCSRSRPQCRVRVCVSVWLKPDGSWCLMISQALSGGRGGRSNSISGQTMAIVFSSLTILYLRPSVYMYKGKAIVFRPSVDMFIGRHGPIVQHCSLPGLVSCCNALGGFVSNHTIPSVLDHILPMSFYTSKQMHTMYVQPYHTIGA